MTVWVLSWSSDAWNTLLNLAIKNSLQYTCKVILGPWGVIASGIYLTPAGGEEFRDLPEPPACAAVKKLVAENRLPHLLFYGPPGTGKTSTILAVARQIYGPSISNMVLELNASDDRGIGVVRQQVVDFASTRTIFRYFVCVMTVSVFEPR